MLIAVLVNHIEFYRTSSLQRYLSNGMFYVDKSSILKIVPKLLKATISHSFHIP